MALWWLYGKATSVHMGLFLDGIMWLWTNVREYCILDIPVILLHRFVSCLYAPKLNCISIHPVIKKLSPLKACKWLRGAHATCKTWRSPMASGNGPMLCSIVSQIVSPAMCAVDNRKINLMLRSRGVVGALYRIWA